ncbi:MAG: tetratricopeptide repeat protein [Terracidiphilus sp.]
MALALTVACLARAAGSAQIPPATLAQADAYLQAGEADKSIALLAPLPTTGPGAAGAQNLLCRVRFMLQQWSQAAAACQLAVNLDGQNSNDHMWLGRALGQKADRASFLTAFSLGKRVRNEFEEAVRLDPRNAEALSDLGEFYEDAPGIVGGGTDKAETIAARLDKVDPARAAQLRGNIAEAHKDYGTAERKFKQAITVSPHPAAQWMNLASFYRRRQRWADMEAAIHNCVNAAAHNPRSGVALYDGAGVLIESNRDPALAARMLEDYLAGSSKTEEAPAFIAHIRLGRLKEQLGDPAGAQREFAAAYAMAREYNPAQDSKH